MQNPLVVEGVRKRFGNHQALDGVAFTLRPGERLAMLGPNGAGKSTLVRCIAGRVAPDQGELRSFGCKLLPRATRDSIGIVPQEIALYDDLSARENLQIFGRCFGLRGRKLEQNVDWALDWAGLMERGDSLVRGFSGGMKRRINIACGVIHQPKVVVLDEPTVGVDPQSRERIYEMLDQLRAAGSSILLTTHYLEEAEQQCDRIVIIDHGRVIAEGTVDELVSRSLGHHRQVRLTTSQPLPWRIEGFEVDPCSGVLYGQIDSIATGLPPLLHAVESAGVAICDVDVRTPSLHSVYLHLTGRELRE